MTLETLGFEETFWMMEIGTIELDIVMTSFFNVRGVKLTRYSPTTCQEEEEEK